MDKCECGSGLEREPDYDGYGIFLFYSCKKCWAKKISHYRKDIYEHYECDEPIEAED